MFVSNVQGTEEIRSKINPARSAFPCLQSRREISLRTEGRIYKTVVCSILLYDCAKWSVRVGHKRVLAVFDNKSIRRILHVRSRDNVPFVELRSRNSIQVYRHNSCRACYATMLTLQDVQTVN